jgi:AcrR family transcriptional regulator
MKDTDMISNTTTPERIIEAAADIFGKEGFKATTIRAIATKASANVASINYHFGDKQGLYSAVLEHLFKTSFERFPADMGIHDSMDPKEQLHAFIRGMFHRLLSIEGWNGLTGPGKLIARELLDPTPSLETIVKQYIQPHKQRLLTILISIPEGPKEPKKLLSCALSIIGQCIYYAFAAPIITRIASDAAATPDNLDQLADFVFHFSLGGLTTIGASNQCPHPENTNNA